MNISGKPPNEYGKSGNDTKPKSRRQRITSTLQKGKQLCRVTMVWNDNPDFKETYDGYDDATEE